MKLTKRAKEILSTEQNKIRLCYLTGKSYATIHRWIRDDNERLTMLQVIKSIIEVSGLSEEEIFETETK